MFKNQLLQTCITIKRTCISSFSKIGFVDRHNLAHKCIRQKIPSFINLQLPIEIFKNRLFQTCVIVKRTCMSTFSKIGLIDQSKPCTQICLPKNCKLHKFPTCNSNFENSRLSGMHYPITAIQVNFGINRLIRYQVTAKRNDFHRLTDKRVDRRRARQQ